MTAYARTGAFRTSSVPSESYIDFKFTVYRLYYVYFLPFEHLGSFWMI